MRAKTSVERKVYTGVNSLSESYGTSMRQSWSCSGISEFARSFNGRRSTECLTDDYHSCSYSGK